MSDWDVPIENLEAETPLEPGSPSLENVVFVILGALLTVFVLWRLLAVFT